jgi:hypothetical protein
MEMRPLTFLDKHHRRQIVRVPAGGDLTQARRDARFQGLHPMVRVLGVVDGDPLVARAQPVALAVVVGEGVVVFEAVLEHELGAFLGGFPPALERLGLLVLRWGGFFEGGSVALPGRDDAARRFAVLELGDEVVAL